MELLHQSIKCELIFARALSRVFNKIFENMEWELKGELLFPASHLIVAEPERLSSQLEAVTMCGQEFASEGKISEELLEAANREYIDDPEVALRHMTQMILKMRRDNQVNSAGAKTSKGATNETKSWRGYGL